MRHVQATHHVTLETKLSLPIEVELEPADSIVDGGQRVYSVGFYSNEMLIHRHTGCGLESLRYRFLAGNDPESSAVLSPWTCRDEFLHEGTALRKCNAGLTAKRAGRGKAAELVLVRSKDNPTHSWALGLDGVAGRDRTGA